MAYYSTVDERYGGTYSSSQAGARDAPNSIYSNPYVISAGLANAAYGTLVYTNFYTIDSDIYGLGTLAP